MAKKKHTAKLIAFRVAFFLGTVFFLTLAEETKSDPEYYLPIIKAVALWLYAELFMLSLKAFDCK